MSLKRFTIEEWVGSLVLSSIPLLVSNSVLLAAFSKIVWILSNIAYIYMSVSDSASFTRRQIQFEPPKVGAWSRSCGLAAGCWMLDAPFDSSPEFITPELEQQWYDLCCKRGIYIVTYCPFTHPSYCKSHGGGLMLQWAVITSGPSPVSVLVYYPWHRSDCNIREEHSNCCNKTCNLHIEQQTGTWTSQPAKWAIHCWCWWPGEGWVIISSNWGPRDSWRHHRSRTRVTRYR